MGMARLALVIALLATGAANAQPTPMGGGSNPWQGVSPAATCAAFLPEDRPQCEERVRHHLARMDELRRQQAGGETGEGCDLHCDVYQEMWRLRNDTKGWSIRAIRAVTGDARAQRAAELAGLDARRAGLTAERDPLAAELEDLRKGRVIQLYQNSETGAIVEHSGRFFEPSPPLRHVGDRRAPQMAGGLRRIAEGEVRLGELDAELAELDAERARLDPRNAPPDATERVIQSMWGNDCNELEAQAWLADCRKCGRGELTARTCPF